MKKIIYISLSLFCYFQFAQISLRAESTFANESEWEEPAGTYPLEIEVQNPDGSWSKNEITITIFNRKTEENIGVQEAIDAKDIEIEEHRLQQLSDIDLLHATKAKAWNLQTGEEVPITTITRKAKNKELGHYQVTFATDKKTTITINVIENIRFAHSLTGITYYNIEDDTKITTGHLMINTVLIIVPLLLLFNYQRLNKEVREIEKVLYSKK